MRLKADENIPARVIELLRQYGHDVSTVADQDLVGARDRALAEAAVSEDRILITVDRGFGDVRVYPRQSSDRAVGLGFVTHAEVPVWRTSMTERYGTRTGDLGGPGCPRRRQPALNGAE